MGAWLVRLAGRDDLEPLSHLVAGQNQNPATRCIHSETGASQQATYDELTSLYDSGELVFVVAEDGSRLRGALGCELDEKAARGWLRGPFALAEGESWTRLAEALFQALRGALPAAIGCLDSFLDEANERGNRFYLDHGFRRIRLAHVYTAQSMLAAGQAPALGSQETPGLTLACATAGDELLPAVAALHDATFPTTYVSGQDLVAMPDENRQLFVCRRGGTVLGYLAASLELGSGEGYVDFVGVRQDAQGQGLGRRLLDAALHWFFQVRGLARANLVVNDDLVNARSLYEKAGFRHKYTGVHNRWTG